MSNEEPTVTNTSEALVLLRVVWVELKSTDYARRKFTFQPVSTDTKPGLLVQVPARVVSPEGILSLEEFAFLVSTVEVATSLIEEDIVTENLHQNKGGDF